MLTSQLVEQTVQQSLAATQYPEFASDMDYWGYTWDAHKVKTEDGFILTTFHITGKKGHEIVTDATRAPIILMHGLSCDAESWVRVDSDTPPVEDVAGPLPLRLFDDGFDVWMASNRGTKYCQEHETLDINSKEYWDFSWVEMGKYDDVSNIKYVKEQTGAPKVSYIGESQGSVQMFYLLATMEEEFLKDNLFTFAAVDPCTIDVSEGDALYEEGLFHFEEYGINVFAGPNWAQDRGTICSNFS